VIQELNLHKNSQTRFWSQADWLEPLRGHRNLTVVAVGTGELLALDDKPNTIEYARDIHFYNEQWTEQERRTIVEWTTNLPQLRWVFMMYGYNNSDNIELGFNPDWVDSQSSLFERTEDGSWESRYESLNAYERCFPPRHPLGFS
jgi:hypothetical protein